MFRLTLLIFTLAFSLAYCVNAQAPVRKLPSNINRASISLFSPYISGDGETLVFLSNYTDDGHYRMRWAKKLTVSTWSDPIEISRLIDQPTLTFKGGHSLSFDGDLLLFTSRKSGIGGFDLWYSERDGNSWDVARNFGKPVNSDMHDGSPSLSPDGQYLYFMRCEQMNTYKGASGCAIYRSKKGPTRWEPPVRLPDIINTGNSQTPRLLADGETLLFSTDQLGGKGGLDLFMSKKVGDNEWTKPVPYDFLNTPKDDSFVSVPAKGRYAYLDQQNDRGDHQLMMLLIPDYLKPHAVMRVKGQVVNEMGDPVQADLSIFDITNRDRLWNETLNENGDFAVVLKEGNNYDLSVDVPGYMFYSKIFELEEIGSRDRTTLNINLEPLKANTSYNSAITFDGKSLNEASVFELRRIGDLLRRNSSMKVEFEVIQPNYKEDTIQSDPDLTEIEIDTVYFDPPALPEEAEYYTQQLNDLDYSIEEQNVLIEGDTMLVEISYDSISFYYPSAMKSDTVATDSMAIDSPKYILADRYKLNRMKINKKYHNDRTADQAEALRIFMLERGVKPEQFTIETSKHKKKEGEEDPVFVKMGIKSL